MNLTYIIALTTVISGAIGIFADTESRPILSRWLKVILFGLLVVIQVASVLIQKDQDHEQKQIQLKFDQTVANQKSNALLLNKKIIDTLEESKRKLAAINDTLRQELSSKTADLASNVNEATGALYYMLDSVSSSLTNELDKSNKSLSNTVAGNDGYPRFALGQTQYKGLFRGIIVNSSSTDVHNLKYQILNFDSASKAKTPDEEAVFAGKIKSGFIPILLTGDREPTGIQIKDNTKPGLLEAHFKMRGKNLIQQYSYAFVGGELQEKSKLYFIRDKKLVLYKTFYTDSVAFNPVMESLFKGHYWKYF